MVSAGKKAELLRQFEENYKSTGLLEVGVDTVTGLVNVVAYHVTARTANSLKFQLGKVEANFSCNRLGLTTLEGCPLVVLGNFSCHTNQLTSLQGLSQLQNPGQQGWFFSCAFNQLKNFQHMDQNFEGYFVGVDQGHPQALTSIDGLPKQARLVEITYQPNLPLLKLLEFKRVNVREPGNGPRVDLISDIFNKYAGEGKRGAIRCQKALIAAGFEGNAKW
jgi:hypothetical protein